jgi:hypothetical protein
VFRVDFQQRAVCFKPTQNIFAWFNAINPQNDAMLTD